MTSVDSIETYPKWDKSKDLVKWKRRDKCNDKNKTT